LGDQETIGRKGSRDGARWTGLQSGKKGSHYSRKGSTRDFDAKFGADERAKKKGRDSPLIEHHGGRAAK